MSHSIKLILDVPAYYAPVKGAMMPRTLKKSGSHFCVIIQNTSTQPVRLKRFNGSMEGLHFELTHGGQTQEIREVRPNASAVVVDMLQIDPGQAAAIEIPYYGDNSSRMIKFLFPFPKHGEEKATIRAVLEQKAPAGAEMNWTGKAVSEPCEIVLDSNP